MTDSEMLELAAKQPASPSPAQPPRSAGANMNNELIERIEEEIGDWAKVVVPPAHIRLLQDCKAALTEKREDEDHRELEYHLLASEMVYEGNSVQHWRQKALAYKECAGVIYELKSLLGVETPADVLEQVKTQQQEAEPVAPWPILLEPDDIEHIAYQAGMEAKAMEGSEPGPAALAVGWSEDDDGVKSYGLHVYCDDCQEEGVIPLARFHPPKPAAQPTMDDATSVGDRMLHIAIDYWKERALKAEAAQPVDERKCSECGDGSENLSLYCVSRLNHDGWHLMTEEEQAAQPQVPEGYVLVPIRPLETVLRISDREHEAWDAVKSAMLSAAKEES